MRTALLLVLALALTPLVLAEDPPDTTPKELGAVTFLRDHDAAFLKARETKTPVFLFFQEVPG